MIRRYRYDVIGAGLAGHDQHPQSVILGLAPEATNFEPVALADCWLFDAEEIENPPDIIEVMPSLAEPT